MHTTIAIIGGGLAGLSTAHLLHTANIDFHVFEARARPGGRILSTDEAGHPATDGFDLGPSWFWPAHQPELAALIDDLGLTTFPQYTDGDILVERGAHEAVQRFRPMPQGPTSPGVATPSPPKSPG